MAHGGRHPTDMDATQTGGISGDGALAFAIEEMTPAFATGVRGNDVRHLAT
jgi:hypothetical protein